MLKRSNIDELICNPFELIGKKWTLITAGDDQKFNTMTASWGALGFNWGSPCATIYVRPQRYTKEFLDQNDIFTLSFFDDEYKKALEFCGANSGRDVDKLDKTGLSVCRYGEGLSFLEAKMVVVCQKVYAQEFKEDCFLDKELVKKWYQNDFHTMYIGKILEIYS